MVGSRLVSWLLRNIDTEQLAQKLARTEVMQRAASSAVRMMDRVEEAKEEIEEELARNGVTSSTVIENLRDKKQSFVEDAKADWNDIVKKLG